jgi:hypothetical protein
MRFSKNGESLSGFLMQRLFGVAEIKDGLQIASSMINVLLTGWKEEVTDGRIGSAD